MTLSGLKPEKLWEYFGKILEIPHCSGNEEQLAEYLLSLADEKGYEAEKDNAGNVVIRVPATEGHEDAPTVVLQGHLDMVCEKNSDVDVDFMKDGITAKKEGDWITAEGTTLGADNGIGLAAALAVAEDKDAVHGPLEILATVSEEVGLIGAGELQPGFLKGEIMLNLDSEEIGEVYIGCAGGGDSVLRLPLEMVDTPADSSLLSVHVKGLRGGHSGIDIIEQRGNAIKILARVISRISDSHDLLTGSIEGGSKRNAIPREAKAVVAVGGADQAAVEKIVAAETDDISKELGGTEAGLEIVVEEAGDIRI